MGVEVKTTEQGANAELGAVLEGLKSIEGGQPPGVPTHQHPPQPKGTPSPLQPHQ